MRRSIVALCLALVLLPALGACAVLPSASPSAAAGPKIVASTTVLADLVRQVGNGRLASVASIVPPGVDVEDYNPTPADLRSVAAANLLVTNGLGLDRWAPKIAESAHPGMPTLVLSDALPVLSVDGEPNPHLWLDVTLARAYVQKIHDRLVADDPQGAPTYDANTTTYLAQLEALDQWINQQVQTLPVERRKLVTFHDAYPYFAARYGFELIGVITPSPGQEPSAGELAALVQQVKAAHVPAVFSEAQFSPRLMQTLADEAGVTTVVTDLYNDSLGDAPVDTYVGMMHFDVDRMVHALS